MYKILEIDPYLKPYQDDINLRMELYEKAKKRLLSSGQTLSSFANGYLHYGFHQTDNGWFYREWAPGADSLSLKGDFNGWDNHSHPLTAQQNGDWEIFIPGKNALPHKSLVKVHVTSKGSEFDRIPLYINRIVQDPHNNNSNGMIWAPEEEAREVYKWNVKAFSLSTTEPPLIYECHIGMSSEEGKINTYSEFMDNVLPRIKKCGYNIIQLMAVMEHPYYASFGYQVANFFSASSRFGTPEELKQLVDTAHSMGIAVLLDLVHSHAATNTLDGINEFDGTDYQFFHAGNAGQHPAWGTKLFNYAKPEVIHFLLSNLKYWMEEYRFDGFRFDGVTSMLYHHHGLGEAFDNYAKYFSMATDTDAVTYLQLANELIHDLNKNAVTIAEDMSGMPGMCIPIEYGGIGFDYRLAMGVPDYWVKTVQTRDEDWDLGKMWYELTTRRPKEKNIGYCESHDQALVGDKTIMFWLADSDMYWHMDLSGSLNIDRAIALHKLIRLVSMSLSGEGYMNFMGNEFGHPEWIDFPREGNGNSFHYARRQWSLSENQNLKYQFLLEFDRAMINLAKTGDMLGLNHKSKLIRLDNDSKIICYKKGDYLFAFNFHMNKNNTIEVPEPKKHRILLNSDDKQFGGFEYSSCELDKARNNISIKLNPRTAIVIKCD
ncbi:4-alpha-glucan-branching enzyme [Holotrichia oblita]|nr:4-alpha-glucan-branching enzyme [Holotrichia oblita]